MIVACNFVLIYLPIILIVLTTNADPVSLVNDVGIANTETRLVLRL